MTAKTVSPGERRGSLSRLAGWVGPWEAALLGLVVVVLIFGSVTSPFFFTGANFSNTSAGAVGVSLMVVGQTWLMVSGEIDLSVASVFGISGVVFGLSIESQAPLPVAIAIALLVGAVAGLINGLLSVDLGLPSLIVTVGSLALFRGASYILLGSRAISALPIAFTGFAQGDVGTSVLPNVLVVFLVIAVLAGTFLQWGSVGRKTYAAGSSLEVSRFSGHRVKRLKRGLFVLSGALSALAGVLYTGYVSTARADNGTGQELTVIAIVLIGGVSMFGQGLLYWRHAVARFGHVAHKPDDAQLHELRRSVHGDRTFDGRRGGCAASHTGSSRDARGKARPQGQRGAHIGTRYGLCLRPPLDPSQSSIVIEGWRQQ